MTKIQQVAKDYGESFPVVVKGFARMGYSKKRTAETLGYTEGGFHKILTTWGLHSHFLPRSQQRDECRGKGVARPQRYSDAELLSAVARAGSCRKFASETGIAVNTVVVRFGSWSAAREMAG